MESRAQYRPGDRVEVQTRGLQWQPDQRWPERGLRMSATVPAGALPADGWVAAVVLRAERAGDYAVRIGAAPTEWIVPADRLRPARVGR